MHRLSSKATFFYKRIFPFLFIFLPIIFAAIALFGGFTAGQESQLPFVLVPIVMVIIFYFVMKKLIFDLVDEVVDQGDTLLVRNGGREDRIALSDIMNVNYSALTSPPRVMLSLRKPSLFGAEVSFCAPLRFIPFSTSPLIEQLIVRVDAARRAAPRRR